LVRIDNWKIPMPAPEEKDRTISAILDAGFPEEK